MKRWTCRPADVCRLARITRPQLEHFNVLGLIAPLRAAPGSGSARVYSLRNVYEAALAGELIGAGLSGQQLQVIFAALARTVDALPARLQASAVFLKYVDSVKALAALLGHRDDAAYQRWHRTADAMIRSWQRMPTALDDDALPLLTAGRSFGDVERHVQDDGGR